MRRKRARGRRLPSSPAEAESTDPAIRQWSLCEWFTPWLDAPFFAFNEFDDVIRSMGMGAQYTSGATRVEWSRLRAAMCNAFVGGHAAPRRLSRAFLAMEAADLAIYRADARAVLRSLPLPPAIDPVSGEALGDSWWMRYRFNAPSAPAEGSPVLLRAGGGRVLQTTFVALEGTDRARVLLPTGVEGNVPDVDIMLPPTNAGASDVNNANSNSPGLQIGGGTPNAAFSLPALSPLADAGVVGLRTPPSARRALFGPRTPLALAGGSALRPSMLSDFSGGGGTVPCLLSPSPRATLVASPRVSAPLVTRVADGAPPAAAAQGDVEAEVDVGRLAELIRLYDRKAASVNTLAAVCTDAEREMTEGGAVNAKTHSAYEAAVLSLNELNARVSAIAPAGMDVQDPIGESPPVLGQPFRVTKRLDAAFVAAGAAENALPAPAAQESATKRPRTDGGLGLAGMLGPGSLAMFDNQRLRGPLLSSGVGGATKNNGAAGGNGMMLGPASNGTSAGGPLSGPGSTMELASALCKSTFNRYQNHPKFAKLKEADGHAKADVMRCVSGIVGILIAARTTRDPAAVQALVDSLRLRFPGMPDAMQLASSLFEVTSSDTH